MKVIMKRLIYLLIVISLIGGAIYVGYHATQAPPIRFTFVAGRFEAPLDLVSPRDGTDRLFVVDKPGRIWIVNADHTVNEQPFLDLRERINSEIERGLLGLAFSPDYAENGRFYVYYTDIDGHSIIAEFRVSDDPDRADPDSERVLLWVDQPSSNHVGGHLLFGPDEMLYIGFGDGGGGTRTDVNSQDNANLLGALIRIDVRNLNEDDDLPYDIPPDNPFREDVDQRDEIWAYGLRNPWRFSFDAESGDLYIADVGEATYEELNYIPAPLEGGYNFGWNIMEGLHCNSLEYSGDECDQSGLILPVIEYPHGGGNIAITGGVVYYGEAIPFLRGKYLFSDYGSGRIWATSAEDEWRPVELINPLMFIDSFGVDDQGELYVVDLRSDAVYKIEPRTLWQRLIYFTGRE